jgi:hypothetical protein
VAPLRHADRRCERLFIAVDRKWSIRGQNDAIDPGCVKTRRKFIKLVGGAVTIWPFAACSRRNSDAIAGLWAHGIGDRGKRTQARDLLAPIYGWFTEGFDTPDFKEAKALLEELGIGVTLR